MTRPKPKIKNSTVIKIIWESPDEKIEIANELTVIDWLDQNVGEDNYETIWNYDHRPICGKTSSIFYHFRYEQDATLFALRYA